MKYPKGGSMDGEGGQDGQQGDRFHGMNLFEKMIEQTKLPGAVLGEAQHQASKGGKSDKDQPHSRGGPFWPRATWENYVGRAKKHMREAKTTTQEELDAAYATLDEITAQKDANGELF